MKRRTFLSLAGGLALASAAPGALPRSLAAAAIDRKSRWAPVASDVVQWRYVAGRIANGQDDYGFIVSLTDIKFPLQPAQELMVERQDFTGAKTFASGSYTGTLTYNQNTFTYAFQDSGNQASASWQWDDAAGVYRLTVSSPQLNLSNVVLRPQGGLIPEGGDGDIRVGEVAGFSVGSDYHADWTTVEIGGNSAGVARLDMQGLYPLLQAAAARPAATAADYDHHWFAIFGSVGGRPVRVSCWRIESASGPYWVVTIARGGNGAAYDALISRTEANTMAHPLAVQPLAFQPLPSDVPAELKGLKTGQRWRVTAGQTTPGDLLDLTVEVPPRQFAQSARFGAAAGLSWMEEALGAATASGTVAGQRLTEVQLVVAETTAEYDMLYVPIAQR